MPLVEDQQRADAAPEQPPEGAMSFSEFVRSGSDDSEMSMMKVIINRLLENEDKTAQARENIYTDMMQGRISAPDGFFHLLGNDRNASCQRIGFLMGYATAIGMESDILTKVQSSFAGIRNYTPDISGGAGTNGVNSDTNGDEIMADSREPSGECEIDSADGTNDDVEANGLTGADGTGDAYAPGCNK